MKAHRPAILVVSSPSPISGGGSLRALRSLREYVKYFKTYLVIPWGLWDNKEYLRESIDYVRELKEVGVKLAGFSSLPGIIYKLYKSTGFRGFRELPPLITPSVAKIRVSGGNYDGVVVPHEVWDAVYTGMVLAEHFNAPSMALLQLPPFYGCRERFLNILKAIILWRKLRSSSLIEEIILEAEALARNLTTEYLRKHRMKNALRKYDLILSVSRSIPIEMGSEWVNRVTPLDPGVSLDDRDLGLINYIREKVREKGKYIVFGGRPDAGKGLAEALIVFKHISKYFPGLKLVITGKIPSQVLLLAMRFCRRMGIESKVVFTGFTTREERFKIVAKAKLMLYPSHVDAFSYAVLESLYLGTPIVAYRIPALEIYYGRSAGVKLVEEWDLEALTVEAINTLEKSVEAIEPPRIKSWGEVMAEEVELISRLVRRS